MPKVTPPTTRFHDLGAWRHPSHPILRLQPLLGRDWATAYLFMLPSALILGGLIAYPFTRAIYISFTRTQGAAIGPFVGLANYLDLWADRYFRQAVWVTVQYTALSVSLTLLLSLLGAILLHRSRRGAGLMTSLLLLPWITPEIVRAVAWRGLLDPLHGGINSLLIALGLITRGFPFLGSFQTALPSVALVNVWQRVPFFAVNLLVGLKAVNPELHEAAAIDGASRWRQFLHVTLPAIRDVIALVALLGTMWSFNEFSLIFLLTGGGPANATKVYSVLAYQYSRNRAGLGMAVALSMAPVFVLMILALGRRLMGAAPAGPSGLRVKHCLPGRALRLLEAQLTRLGKRVTALFWFLHDGVESLVEAIALWLKNRRMVLRGGYRSGHKVPRLALPSVWLLLLLVFELAPFYWMLVTAFKTELQITRFESVLWPTPWSLDQFRRLLGRDQLFVIWLQNTLIISLITSLISTLAASLGAYAITRLRWRGARFLGNAALVFYLMPTVLLILPIAQLLMRWGLANTRLSLIISYPALTVPFAIWLMMGHYGSLPEEIEDAALIDGCDHWRAFWWVVLPLSRPALVAAALFSFSQVWSEFLLAYSLILSSSKMTIPQGLGQMVFGDVLPWGQLSASALLVAIPVLTIYLLGQRFMVTGLTRGAVQG